VNTSRTLPPAPAAPRSSWTAFWFSATDPVGLHALRVLAGLLFLAWLLPFAGREAEFFGPQGWFDLPALREAAHMAATAPDTVPAPIGWSALYLCRFNPALVHVLYWGSVAGLVLFTLGVATRLTSVLTWVAVVSFTANPALSYDADPLLGLLAFYLMVGYVLYGLWGGGRSPRERLLGPADTFLFARRGEGGRRPSYAANLAVRLLQVHFAIVLVVGGLHKLQVGDWWSGVALWYPLHPPFTTTAESIRAYRGGARFYLQMLSLVSYGVLAWQIGFPFFAWRRRWRPVLLGGAALGWLGSAFVHRLPLFGPVLAIGCLSYLTPAEWQAVTGRLGGLFRRPGAARQPEARPAAPARVAAKA
jgi:hypothetical protein